MRTRHLLLLTFIVLTALFASAQKTKADSANVTSHPIKVSLITFYPGDEIFEVFGHSEILLSDSTGYYYINYGVFDFNSPGFIMRYIMGETDYLCAIMPPNHDSGIKNGRKRVQQELNLTPEQAQKVWDALAWNVRPENREYRYRHFSDNCATRPLNLLLAVLDREAGVSGEESAITSTYQGAEGVTYRTFIQRYIPKGAWADLGINLLFGPRADQAMNNEQRLFLPEELMLFLQHAHLSDGTPVVSESSIGAFAAPQTPWYASWPLGLVLYFVLICLISYHDRKRQRWSWGVEVAVGIPYLLLLIIVTFLTFFSCHPLVGFGWRLLIIPFTHLCARLIYIIR